MSIKGYFCDCNGVIYAVADCYDGGCNAPYHVIVTGDTVERCGSYEHGNGWPIDDTYTLWPTLTSLAAAIEGDKVEVCDD